MTQSCAGCTAGQRATLPRAVGCASLVVAMVLALGWHPATAARRVPAADQIAAAGRVGAGWILLAAKNLGDKPEPGSDKPSPAGPSGPPSSDDMRPSGPPRDPGNQTPTAAARPISTASQCDRTPSIDGQGGGLASDEQASVCYAVLALSRIGVDARTTYEALASQLYDSNPRYRKQAAEKIGQISGGLVDALPLLVEALGASDPRVKRTAAMIATDIREYARDVVPALERVARDQDKVVARAGVQSLVDLGPYVGKGLPTLAAALDHRDLGVRYFAGEGITRVDSQMRTTARALRRISGDHWDTSRVALQALEDDLRQHRASPFRARAVATLAGIGPAGRKQLDTLLASGPDLRTVDDLKDISRFTTDAVPPLMTALAEPDYPGSRSEVGDLDVAIGFGQLVQGLDADDEMVRLASAQALQETSTSVARTLAALKDAPRADRFVRRAAGSVQNSIEASTDDAVPALLAVLKGDADPGVRRAAAQTLGQLGPAASGAVPGIARALQSDEAVEVQSAAALALGQIGPGPAETEPVMTVTALADALTDHHPIVRYQAARALGLLGPAAKDGAPELREAARAEPDPAFQ
jgi:HEAT repeat protein